MNILVNKAIEIGVQAGVKAALDKIEKSNEEKMKHRYDKTLKNTKLLLKNYNSFLEHCNNLNIMSKQLKSLNQVEVLDEHDIPKRKDLNINYSRNSENRTYIIVKQINTALEFLKFRARKEKDENAVRRYRAIELVYMERMTYEETAEYFGVSEKTVSRDIKQAIEEIGSIIFGIDAVMLEV